MTQQPSAPPAMPRSTTSANARRVTGSVHGSASACHIRTVPAAAGRGPDPGARARATSGASLLQPVGVRIRVLVVVVMVGGDDPAAGQARHGDDRGAVRLLQPPGAQDLPSLPQ